MNRLTRALVMAAIMTPAMGGSASADEYGAIAFSPRTGAHGYSHNYESRRQAEQVALSACRGYGGGCRVVVYFRNACAALAVGDGYGYGFSWAAGRNQAERRAMRECNNQTYSCQIVRWVCSK